MGVAELALPRRSVFPRHEHQKPLVSVLLAGSYRERLGAWSLDHAPGTVAVHPAGHEHRDELEAGGRMLVLELQPDGPVPLPSAVVGGAPRVVASLGALRAALALRAELWSGAGTCRATTHALLLDLLAAVDPTATDARGAAPGWLRAVVDRLNDEYREPLSLVRVAEDAGVHVGHLWRAFRRAHGCSPWTLVLELRCRYVLRRMGESGPAPSLAELALDAGFSDQSHLTRVFKRHVGVTPGALRRSVGETRP